MVMMRTFSVLTFLLLLLGGCKKEDSPKQNIEVWNPQYCANLLGTYQMISYCSFYDISDGNTYPDTFTATFTIDTSLEMNSDTFAKVSASFIYFFEADSFDPGIYLTADNGALVFHSSRVSGRLVLDANCDTIKDGHYQFEYYDALWDCDSVMAVKVQ
jgi:hypothetical protein